MMSALCQGAGGPGPIFQAEARNALGVSCGTPTCFGCGGIVLIGTCHCGIRFEGPLRSYTRAGKPDPSLEILFCPNCACVLAWRGLRSQPDGRHRAAVNVRLAPPEAVADLKIDHFDGLDSFADLPSDGRCVRDLWF
jgi:hypothetical protein